MSHLSHFKLKTGDRCENSENRERFPFERGISTIKISSDLFDFKDIMN
jgi:hypothetical protein